MMPQEEERFEERLRNWGRWAKDSHWYYSFSAPLPVPSDQEETPRQRISEEIDVIDALEISKAWTAIGGDFSTLRIQKAKFVVAIRYIERGKSDHEIISFIRKIWGLSIRVSELKDLIPFGKYLISKHLDSPF